MPVIGLSTYETVAVYHFIKRPLEIDDFAPHAGLFIVNMQETDAAGGLTAAVVGAARIEEQLTIIFLVIGYMGMPKDHHTRMRKFPSCHLCMGRSIAQDMHNADAAAANYDLAFNGQL